MILSIIKKVTAIYKVSSFFLLAGLLSVSIAQASTGPNSYCFDKNVNLRDVYQSLKIFLLPRDIVDLRIENNCIDISTSANREKLFEKYLSKRYDLKSDNRVSEIEKVDLSLKYQECRLDLRTSKKAKVVTNNLKLGKKTILSKGETIADSVKNMELLLGAGKNAEITVGEDILKIVCLLIGNESANLIFSYIEKNKMNFDSQVIAKKGEWINLASVLKDLNEKNKAVGISQGEMIQSTEKNETLYELQYK